VREGFGRKEDTLPKRMLAEPLKKAGPASGQTVAELDVLLDEYYQAFSYTPDGVPTLEKLEDLDLAPIE
jgi:aldehyde:ferredoxin oxidoreductase